MIYLNFPLTGGGCEIGPNDAGLETFKSDVELSLARECVQNSIDARHDKTRPVRVKFSVSHYDISSLPAMERLRDVVIPACRAFQAGDHKAQTYCNAAEEMLARTEIPVMRISDENTIGLSGSDADRQGGWYALVMASGVSNKPGGSGGSFGIGKYAPLAASSLRTVFYGTRTVDGEVALQGVTEWWSHENSDGKITQGRGYIGLVNEECDGLGRFCAVRNEEVIPALFQREHPGTDVWVVGFDDENEWQDWIVFYLLENFWLSVHEGIVEFDVDGISITADTLDALLREYYEKEDSFDAWYQYWAFKSGDRKQKTFPYLGEIDLYLLVHDREELPRKVSGLRKTGMLIEKRIEGQRSRCKRQYAGVLHCHNDAGNEILRSMEPPCHDEWIIARASSDDHRNDYQDMINWVREELLSLNPKATTDPVDIGGLAKLLPDLPSDRDMEPDENERDFEARASDGEIEIRFESDRRPTEEAGETGGEEEGGEGAGDGSSSDKGGEGQSGGNSRIGRAKRVGLRAISKGDAEQVLVIRSDETLSGDLVLSAITDNDVEYGAEIASAQMGGKALRVCGNRIVGMDVTAGEPLRISVSFKEQIPMALSAYVALGSES